MPQSSWIRTLSPRKSVSGFIHLYRSIQSVPNHVINSVTSEVNQHTSSLNPLPTCYQASIVCGSFNNTATINGIVSTSLGLRQHYRFKSYTTPCPTDEATVHFCTVARTTDDDNVTANSEKIDLDHDELIAKGEPVVADANKKPVDFTKIKVELLPSVILVGRPNVGKSALFNRFIRRREALVYNTPDDHVTRDIREGIAKLGDLRFRVLDSAGLEMVASSGSILDRTSEMTANVLARSQLALFLIDVRNGLHPMDLEVGKWMRKHASGINTILVMNKSESLDDGAGYLTAAAGEAHRLGFGDAIAISAETGMGMAELYEVLRPLLEDYMLKALNAQEVGEDSNSCEVEESRLPLQLAIVGRPNVGKSTLLNTLLQEDRVMVGPEAGLTRDSIRAQFEYEGRIIYLVDTAGWLQRTTKQEKGPASLSVMQSRKSIMRAHIVALVLDAEEISNARSSMNHAEVVIARRAVEEGRGLIVIVNKMDLLRGKRNSYEKVLEAVPQEIQSIIPQVTGIPVVFISALEGRGRTEVMHQVVDTYEKWCLRLSTARLNRWLHKVMSRHSWKNQVAQPKIKYFTQVKARPPTFVAFVSGKTLFSETDLRFLTKSLKEDFDIGGIPIRIMQRTIERKMNGNSSSKKSSSSSSSSSHSAGRQRMVSDKRNVLKTSNLNLKLEETDCNYVVGS